MNGNQRWLGWIAIGLGALALVVALAGRSFGQQAMAAMQGGAPQAYSQQSSGQQRGGGQQRGQVAPGANTQAGPGQPSGQMAPGTNGQQGGQQAAPQGGRMGRGENAQQGGGRPGEGRGQRGGWFGSLFHGLANFSKLGMVALLAVAGVWLLRRRNASGAPSTAQAAPVAQAEPDRPSGESPTGESYDVE